jgi:ribosomal protein S18 acetylase RimI-like enzyme
MKELPDDRLLTIKYNFESLLYEAENYRYKQSTLGRIMLQDEQGNDLEEIGRLYIDKLLFGEGSNNDWGMFEIFDTEQYLMDLGCLIWDLEVNDYVEPLNKFFEYDIHQIDMLYVHTFEVLPAYRGMQIGEHALKDAYNNLSQGCGLMVVDCVPIQHTTWGAKDEEWHKKMRYELFEPDKEKAKDRLVQYLKRTGFYYLPEVSKDHMFLSTARRNNNFDYIELT